VNEKTYLVALKAESMDSRGEGIRWLKDRGATHVLADVWLLKARYNRAGEITRELARFQTFDGPILVLRLFSSTDYGQKNLSTEADDWLRTNVGP
jgi:hypothetical protein